jgi:hypothetical protein
MGYEVTTIGKRDERSDIQYVGSVTTKSLADNGAFDGDVSKELEELADSDDSIIAIVDENGIDKFLSIAKSGQCHGRWLDKVIEAVESDARVKTGFMIIQ